MNYSNLSNYQIIDYFTIYYKMIKGLINNKFTLIRKRSDLPPTVLNHK